MTSCVDSDTSLDFFVNAALGRKAFDFVVLDLRKLTSIADYFVICSGRSNRQVSAIAEFIHLTLKEQGFKPLFIEGIEQGHWVILDYGYVMVHVFYEPTREFYDLEGLWSDADRVKIKSTVNQA
jgi:ribosome-associated protein